MSWTPCETCGEACREYGPLCDFCERETRAPLPAATTVEAEKQEARESEHRRLKGGGRATGKAHLRAIAGAMTAAPGKRTYVVVASIVRSGRTMNVGDEFEACPVGTHVQRWLAEGRIEER